MSAARRRWSLAAVAEVACYVVAVAVVCWPAILHLSTQILGASDDARYYTWLGWRMGRLIASGHLLPTRVPDVIAPFGLDIRLLDGYLPSYVTGLWNLVVGPIAAFNLALITGAILNVVAARVLAVRLSGRRVVRVLVPVAFLTAPPIALGVQLGLLALFWAFSAPLLIADALDVARGTRGVRPVRLALLLVLAYSCSVYFLVFGGLAYFVIVGVAALRERHWALIGRSAVAAGLALLLLLPIVIPRLRFDRAEAGHGADIELLRDSNLYSADALSVLAQPSRSTVLLPRPSVLDRSLFRLPDPSYSLEFTLFPGLLLLAGFVLFLARPSRLRLPLGLATLCMWLFALGPSLRIGGDFVWQHGGTPVSWLPYRVLLAIPGLGALRAPLRAGYVLVALFAAATAAALDRVLATRRARGTVVVVGCAALLLVPNLLLPLPTVTFPTTTASERAMRRIAALAGPRDGVLSVPADCDPSFESYQVFHEAPIVGCAGSFAANPWRSKMGLYARSDAMTKLRCDRRAYGRLPTKARPMQPFGTADIAALRRELHVRFVIVDRAFLRGCPVAQAALPVLERRRFLGGDRRFRVFDLSRAALGPRT